LISNWIFYCSLEKDRQRVSHQYEFSYESSNWNLNWIFCYTDHICKVFLPINIKYQVKQFDLQYAQACVSSIWHYLEIFFHNLLNYIETIYHRELYYASSKMLDHEIFYRNFLKDIKIFLAALIDFYRYLSHSVDDFNEHFVLFFISYALVIHSYFNFLFYILIHWHHHAFINLSCFCYLFDLKTFCSELFHLIHKFFYFHPNLFIDFKFYAN